MTPLGDAKRTDDFAVFSHIRAEHVALYRAILRIFTDAKAAFSLLLRPSDIRVALTIDAMIDLDFGGIQGELLKVER
jgi:hypothetical protein